MVFFASISFAQDRDDDDNFGRLWSVKSAEVAMFKYSKCLVSNSKREKIVLDYLKIPDGHADQDNVNRKLINPNCAPEGSRMSFSGGLFRRTLYAALYSKYFKKSEPLDINLKHSFDYESEFAAKYTNIDEQQIALRKVSDCTVRYNVKAAHDFIIARVNSKKEKELTKAVGDAMASCWTPSIKLRFSKAMFKGQLAEALYKLRILPTSYNEITGDAQ